jgi:hypothetical protein
LNQILSVDSEITPEWLEARSKFTCFNRSPSGFLHKLYLAGEKVVVFNVFESQGCDVWEHIGPGQNLSTLDYLERGQSKGVWFMAQPVDGEYHWNPRQSKDSRRSEESVTAWRYLVIEIDKAPKDLWLKALVQMPLPISAIYDSGGDSIHVLVRIDAESKAQWDEGRDAIKPSLVKLGADPGSLTAVRLTRLSNCRRESKKQLQRLLYLNDQPDCVPLIQKPYVPASLESFMSEFPSEPENSLASQTNGRPEFYYDSALTTFWVKDGRSSWMRVTEGSVKARLKKLGYRAKAQDGQSISPVDLMVVEIQDHHNIDYAGSLAGWKSGVYMINEKRILVRDSPKLIEPMPGQWPLIQNIILNMIGPEQQVYLFGWLRAGIESLHSSTPRVGQILCLAGPKDCGKSLLQNLFTELLGGRSEKAHRYANGETAFNSELFGAEHLMFEDEEASTDIRSRRKFGVKLKEIASNTAHSCHAKHRTALKLPPFWRASVSLNDEPENLLILPPMDESTLDKFIILKAVKHAMPRKTASSEQYKIFWNELCKELPHFKNFLLNCSVRCVPRNDHLFNTITTVRE